MTSYSCWKCGNALTHRLIDDRLVCPCCGAVYVRLFDLAAPVMESEPVAVPCFTAFTLPADFQNWPPDSRASFLTAVRRQMRGDLVNTLDGKIAFTQRESPISRAGQLVASIRALDTGYVFR